MCHKQQHLRQSREVGGGGVTGLTDWSGYCQDVEGENHLTLILKVLVGSRTASPLQPSRAKVTGAAAREAGDGVAVGKEEKSGATIKLHSFSEDI